MHISSALQQRALSGQVGRDVVRLASISRSFVLIEVRRQSVFQSRSVFYLCICVSLSVVTCWLYGDLLVLEVFDWYSGLDGTVAVCIGCYSDISKVILAQRQHIVGRCCCCWVNDFYTLNSELFIIRCLSVLRKLYVEMLLISLLPQVLALLPVRFLMAKRGHSITAEARTLNYLTAKIRTRYLYFQHRTVIICSLHIISNCT
jgi:hypothetical protein